MLLKPHFLPWSRPLLPEVATLLSDRYLRAEEVDLEEVIVAVPGSRAGLPCQPAAGPNHRVEGGRASGRRT